MFAGSNTSCTVLLFIDFKFVAILKQRTEGVSEISPSTFHTETDLQ
jgi:hypothetical protein